MRGTTVTDAAAYSNSAEGRDAPTATPIPVLAGSDPSLAHRLFEITFAAVVLVLTAPLMLLIALIIRLDGPGPVLFFQQRLGKNGKPFTFVKFRTLHADARQRFPELYAYQYSHEELADLKFKIDNDPRVTRCGVWLRKSSLDELPNFWNVLTGDMALVGPRPEIPEMLRYYHGEMLMKFSVRPGVTGPAQISGRGRLKFTDTVAYDLDYVRQHSFRYDLKVLVKTLQKVLMHDGAF
ncbi:MAG: sugar transferase [Burkholderiaceae bacterium]|nr:sugar transferase [Burkholderiaceae bacterium]